MLLEAVHGICPCGDFAVDIYMPEEFRGSSGIYPTCTVISSFRVRIYAFKLSYTIPCYATSGFRHTNK